MTPAGLVEVTFRREDLGELEVRVFDRRHVGDGNLERIGALEQLAPRSPKGVHPGRRVAEHLQLEPGVAELLRQTERLEGIESRLAPAAPRQIADACQ